MQLEQALALAIRYQNIMEPSGILRHALEQAACVIHEEASKALRIVREAYETEQTTINLLSPPRPEPALTASDRIRPKVTELTPWALQAIIDNTAQ